jgi:phosphatidate cytidylyltransferase
MLGWRLIVSAILVPSFFVLCYADARLGERAPILLVLCVLLAVRASWEFLELLKTRSFKTGFPLVAGCTVAVVAASWTSALVPTSDVSSMEMILLTWVGSVLVLFINAAFRYETPGHHMESLAAEVLCVSYVGALLALTTQLRWLAGSDAGYLLIGSAIVAAKCGDIGAYTMGRLFGRRKMIPRLSPGKTWAGAYGAVLGAVLGTCAWLTFATSLFNADWQPPALWAMVVFGVVIGIVGLVGDLCESLIKRDVEKKDSAALMPGFGGLLDLLDSILFAGPVAYVLWRLLPLTTWVS